MNLMIETTYDVPAGTTFELDRRVRFRYLNPYPKEVISVKLRRGKCMLNNRYLIPEEELMPDCDKDYDLVLHPETDCRISVLGRMEVTIFEYTNGERLVFKLQQPLEIHYVEIKVTNGYAVRFEVDGCQSAFLQCLRGDLDMFGRVYTATEGKVELPPHFISVVSTETDATFRLHGRTKRLHVSRSKREEFRNAFLKIERLISRERLWSPRILVIGPRNSGKTSICRYLLHRYFTDHYPVFIDLTVSPKTHQVPGIITVQRIDSSFDPIRGFEGYEKSTFYFGYKTPMAMYPLFKMLIKGLLFHTKIIRSDRVLLIDSQSWDDKMCDTIRRYIINELHIDTLVYAKGDGDHYVHEIAEKLKIHEYLWIPSFSEIPDFSLQDRETINERIEINSIERHFRSYPRRFIEKFDALEIYKWIHSEERKTLHYVEAQIEKVQLTKRHEGIILGKSILKKFFNFAVRDGKLAGTNYDERCINAADLCQIKELVRIESVNEDDQKVTFLCHDYPSDSCLLMGRLGYKIPAFS